MALLVVAAGWWQRRVAAEQTAGLPAPVVITVDHGLRDESTSEARMVAEVAGRLGLRHVRLQWNDPKPASGLQAAARTARYRLMAEWAADEVRAAGGTERALVTAHHLDDQAETFLMRLARGSGLDGLSAMRRCEVLVPALHDGRPSGLICTVHRPLLGVEKSRLAATCAAAGVPSCEDASNYDLAFERVRIRQALAVLTGLGVAAGAIAASADRLARARDAILADVDDLLSAVDWHDGAYASLPQSRLAAASEEIGVRVLARLIAGCGGAARPARLARVETLAMDICKTGVADDPATIFGRTLGGCRIDWRPGGMLRVWRESRRGDGLATVTLSPGSAIVWDRRFHIALGAGADRSLTVGPLGADRWRKLRSKRAADPGWSLPNGAGANLPACFAGDEVVAVGGLPTAHPPQLSIRFLGGGDAGRSPVKP